ncbi:MAG: hypothetical protein FJ298_11705 [Planctomycetes bacterium]|nr:hypothetical protein [Planctomycetota bacterium]
MRLAAILGWLALTPVAAALESLAQARELPTDVAASALDVSLSWQELDALILDRHGASEAGRQALNHLMRAKLLDRLATESKLAVGPEAISKKWTELEGELRRTGQAANLPEYLRANRLSEARFREFLRLGIVQELLARAALGVPADRPVNGEQQEMWLDQIVKQRGTLFVAPPYADGVAARCGDLAVRVPEFLEHLKQQLAEDDLRNDCFQALLARRARQRMGGLTDEDQAQAIEQEIERRRVSTENDPSLQGAKFEQVLASQGLTLEILRRDPAIAVATLSELWVERQFGEQGRQRVYAEERAWFDARFGEARELRVLFLRGGLARNELNPRTFEDAERELARLRAQVKNAADFERLAKLRSEDGGTRERGGLLGFVSPGETTVPSELRTAIFSGPRNETEHCVGPVRLANPSGAALVWVGALRPSPGWDEMRGRVHNELRRRFLDECLKQTDVVTYLDRD